jgi:hypothetical protein
MAMSDDSEFERMKQAIRRGEAQGLSPLVSVATMSPRLVNAGALVRQWLDERRAAER